MYSKVYRIAAFTKSPLGGNPAGIVFDADNLTEKEMLNIATEVGYSETAFVMNSDIADFKVRFFTPVDEVDLCGHATIATYNLMRDLDLIKVGDYMQETKAGVLKLRIEEECIFMEQKQPEYLEVIDPIEILKCFIGMRLDQMDDLPVQIVTTGLKDIILPIKDVETLNALEPNFEEIEAISYKYDVVGIHAFSISKSNEFDAHARNFAPRYGINEEGATGTSNGALACYMMKYCGEDNKKNYVIEQGVAMGRPSKIQVGLNIKDGKITAVFVGGTATAIQ